MRVTSPTGNSVSYWHRTLSTVVEFRVQTQAAFGKAARIVGADCRQEQLGRAESDLGTDSQFLSCDLCGGFGIRADLYYVTEVGASQRNAPLALTAARPPCC